jgi:pimeloyl-ACP methyl ester carboxylesterase
MSTLLKKPWYGVILILCLSCNNNKNKKVMPNINKAGLNFTSGHASVNGLDMYYEIYGEGKPLVLIHGGGSTIQTTFGRIIPQLAAHYKLVAVELQNHGRTRSRNVPETFEQDADDVAALLAVLNISKAYFFGFSNGGSTVLQIAIRHPEVTGKIIAASAAYKRNGFIPGFFDGMQHATLLNMPKELQDAFLELNPDTAKLQHMFEKDRDRMIGFKDWDENKLRSVAAPTLIIDGDADVVTVEHSVEMYRLIPNAKLAIIPGEHGKYLGEITTLKNDGNDTIFITPLIRSFLDSM